LTHSGIGRSLFLSLTVVALPAWAQEAFTPAIDSITPSAVTAGGPPVTLTVNGRRFTQNSRVIWRHGTLGASTLTTSFLSEFRLQAIIPANLVEQGGAVPLAVTQTGDVGTFTSNIVTFTIFSRLSITTPCPLPNAIVGQPYSAQFTPDGGTPPYNWTIASGSLPIGLTLNSNGQLAGIAINPVRTTFVVRVTDAQLTSATGECSITSISGTTNQTMFITSITPPGAVQGGTSPVTITIRGLGFIAGSVVIWNFGQPNQMFLDTTLVDPSQLIAVVPASLLISAGSFPIAVRAPVLTAVTFSNAENFIVAPILSLATGCPLPDVALRGNYALTLAASGGFPPYSFSLTQGSLPPDLTLSTGGLVSGIATRAGIAQFTLTVTDNRNNTASRACSIRVLGPLTTNPSSVNFTSDSGGATPAPQDVSLYGAATDVPFTMQAFTDSGGAAWLRVNASGPNAPSLLRVSVEPGSLPPGTYSGRVIVTSDSSSTRTLILPVTLTIRASQVSRLMAQPRTFRFAAPREGGRLSLQVLTVTNPGSVAFQFNAAVVPGTGGNWLSITPTTSFVGPNSPVRIRLQATPAGLGTGAYHSTIQLTTATLAEPIRIPVTLTVSLAPETLIVPQTGLSFRAVSGGPAAGPQPVHAMPGGPLGFFWEATTSSLIGAPFVRTNPASSTSRAGEATSTDVTVDATGLAPGLYFGDVSVATAAAENSPRLVSTVLQVLAPGSNPAPEISPGAMVFTAAPSSPAAAGQPLTVRNVSNDGIEVDYQLHGDNRIWSVTASSNRQVASGESRTFQITANATSFPAGVYRGAVTIQTATHNQVWQMDLLLIVSGRSASPPTACTPARLLPVVTSMTTGLLATSGLPVGIHARVNDDCGAPLTGGTVMVSASNGAVPPFPLTHIGEGRWAGTWQSLGPAGTVALTLDAEDTDRRITGTTILTGAISTNPGIPVLNEDGVVSPVTMAPGSLFAPGGLVATLGSQLTFGNSRAQGFPWPSELGTARISVGGREIPLYLGMDTAGSSLVAGLLPFSLNFNTVHQVAVRRGNLRSHYVDIPLASAQPAILTFSQSGTGQGIIVDAANPFVLVTPENPIPRGGTVTIYCDGLGLVSAPMVTGQPAPASPRPDTIAPVAVTIGGRPASVSYAGLVPLLAGLYQVNATVGDDVTPGYAVPVVITVAGRTSNTATMAVR